MMGMEELIAAYIEGNVSVEERKKVLLYLAGHPEMQDAVLALLDEDVLSEDFNEEETEVEYTALQTELPLDDIAYAAAAFSPKVAIRSKKDGRNIETRMFQRRERMLGFWNELKRDL